MRAANLLASASILMSAAALPAMAQTDLFSRDTVAGVADVRLVGGKGETSFVDGGYGKLRYGHGDAGLHLGEASLVWTPRLTWALSATVDLRYDPDNKDQPVDIVEGFVAFRPTPTGPTRFKARFGMFWPQISLEHTGVGWTTPDVITPSAINSWVGEELKVVGAEATLSRAVADHELSGTAAVFGYDDTSGTLLTFRGWALHDLKSTGSGDFDLPRLSPYMRARQAPATYSTLELDHRWGWYARGEWRLPSRVTFDALYYDNNGDKTAVRARQWSWDTRFWNVGMILDIDDRTRVLAQAMTGSTVMGFRTPSGVWTDVDFRSGYVSASHTLGRHTLTVRGDVFEVLDRSMVKADNNNENGWAATADWRYAVNARTDLRLEALHVWSKRPSRLLYGYLPEKQAQTGLQASLRFGF